MPSIFRLFHKPSWFIHGGLLFLLGAIFSHQMQGQCSAQAIQVLHVSGTQQVGCTSVTVTSVGSTGVLSYCGESPYWVGVGTQSGSYTFSFSPPVSAVSLGITAINNQLVVSSREEVRFEIDGVPYPITVPGTPPVACFTPAVITPMGAITGEVDGVGAWDVMEINTTISTLKVEDIILQGTPNGVVFSLFICSLCCETDAGNIPTPNQTLCAGETLNFTNTGGFLENNDVKEYILFTSLSDTLGSVVATSNTASFGLDPPLQTGVTYYFAAVAGNNNGGSVDPADPCLDFSNASTAIWHPLPEVVLVADNGDLCAGECGTISATFTGTPPFTLIYTTPGGGSSTQTFPGNTGTFQVCAPPDATAGGFTVQATSLSDAFCTCE